MLRPDRPRLGVTSAAEQIGNTSGPGSNVLLAIDPLFVKKGKREIAELKQTRFD